MITVKVLRSGAVKRQSGHVGSCLVNGMKTLRKEALEDAIHLHFYLLLSNISNSSPLEVIAQPWKQESSLQETTEPASTLSLDFLASRTIIK
jgi:hypothetical protein